MRRGFHHVVLEALWAPAVAHGVVARRAFGVAEPAARVNVKSNEYIRLKQEAVALTLTEFSNYHHRFSRVKFDATQTSAVHALLSDLLERRVAQVTNRTIREYIQLAHVAGLHEMGLDVFHRRAALDAKDSTLGVTDFIVDSAYKLRSLDHLQRVAAFCTKKMERYVTEIAGDFGLCRVLWRCVCLAVSAGNPVEKKEALMAAQRIFKENMMVVNVEACNAISVDQLLRRVERIVRYASAGDEGEMMFFRFCVESGLLRSAKQQFTLRSDSESLFAHLIWTCRVGNYTDAALAYFDMSRSRLGLKGVTAESVLAPPPSAGVVASPPPSREVQAVVHGAGPAAEISPVAPAIQSVATSTPPGARVPRADHSDTWAAGGGCDGEGDDDAEGDSGSLSEFVVFRLLSVLQSGKANDKIVEVARVITRDTVELSIGLWSVILIAAGEVRASDLALAAYGYAWSRLSDPTLDDRRGFEYLLQTALNAMSKSQVPNFEVNYLQPCQEEQKTHCSNEFYACMLLQDALNSSDPEAGASRVLRFLEEKEVAMTTRIASLLMKIFLRVESEQLLPFYRDITCRLKLQKQVWVDELLLWADRRRYELTQSDRRYLLDEIQRVRKQSRESKSGESISESLEGLRTQYALLRYDYEYEPRATFLKEGRITEAPSVGDSRVYFLSKRPSSVEQNTNSNRHASLTAVIGIPQVIKDAGRRAMARGDPARDEDFRLFTLDILRGLQEQSECGWR